MPTKNAPEPIRDSRGGSIDSRPAFEPPPESWRESTGSGNLDPRLRLLYAGADRFRTATVRDLVEDTEGKAAAVAKQVARYRLDQDATARVRETELSEIHAQAEDAIAAELTALGKAIASAVANHPVNGDRPLTAAEHPDAILQHTDKPLTGRDLLVALQRIDDQRDAADRLASLTGPEFVVAVKQATRAKDWSTVHAAERAARRLGREHGDDVKTALRDARLAFRSFMFERSAPPGALSIKAIDEARSYIRKTAAIAASRLSVIAPAARRDSNRLDLELTRALGESDVRTLSELTGPQ